MRLQQLLSSFALTVLTAACVELRRTPGVMFATQPPGARVVVDGADSGYVTPCHVDLERAAHEVDLVLDGYNAASVHIDKGGDTWLVLWDEAWINEQTWRFPLFLNARDGLAPIKIERTESPARVYVQLALIEGRDKPRRGAGGR
jgi:hypothetical protein